MLAKKIKDSMITAERVMKKMMQEEKRKKKEFTENNKKAKMPMRDWNADQNY